MSKHKDRYLKYLKSKAWAQIKLDIIQTRGAKCERCGQERKQFRYLHVHHLTYERLFKEEPEDLEILCAACHRAEHGIKKKRKRDKPKAKLKEPTKNKINRLSKKQNKKRKPKKTAIDLRWEAMRKKFGFGNI